MIYRDVIIKLLRIPESVSELTAYHLLNVHPKDVTSELVSAALQRRKNELRQNIPGPQFIPIIAIVEKVLDQAARELSDPARRRKYNEYVKKKVSGRRERTRAGKHDEKRHEKLVACRRLVKGFIDADGALDDAKRPDLRRRLHDLGLTVRQADAILEGIPRPATTAPEAADTSLAFFTAAIDAEIVEEHRLLSAASERKLMTMTDRLGISPEAAARAIDARLEAVGARRGEVDVAERRAAFANEVRERHPDRRAPAGERRRLLALAAMRGLSSADAGEVLRDCLHPLTPGDDGGAPAVETEPPELNELTEADLVENGDAAARTTPPPWPDVAAPPPLPEEDVPITYDLFDHRAADGHAFQRALAAVIIAGTVALVVVLAYFGGLLGERPHPTREETPVAEETPSTPTDPSVSTDPLLEHLLVAAGTPEAAASLLNAAEPDAVARALDVANNLTLSGKATPLTLRVRKLFEEIARHPPTKPRPQQTLITSLLGVVHKTAAAAPEQHARAHAQARLLASLLFLQDNARFFSDLPAFVGNCEKAWTESLSRSPRAPLDDPVRLADAVVDGGYLPAYAMHAQDAQLDAVTMRISHIAADPVTPRSREARQILRIYSGYGTLYGRHPEQTERVKRAANLALCEVLRRTTDGGIAEQTRRYLAVTLKVDVADPLRSVGLATAAARASTADAFAKVIEGTPRPVVVKPPPDATTSPDTAPTLPEPGPDVPVRDIRAAFSKTGSTRGLLSDVALVMLGRCDRVARLTAKRDVWSRDLADVVSAPDDAGRIERLTDSVVLPRLDLAEGDVVKTDTTLPARAAAEVDAIRKDLGATARGLRYRAIERLKQIDNTEAATALMTRLGELSQQKSTTVYPEVNRILRAFLKMSESGIPTQLIRILARSKSSGVAHAINRTLATGTGITAMQLPPANSAEARERCATIWHRALRYRGAVTPWTTPVAVRTTARARRPPRVPTTITTPPATTKPSGPKWQPNEDVRKLVAVVVHYAESGSQPLKTFRWGAPVNATRAVSVAATGEPGERLVTALGIGNGGLARIIRERGKAKVAEAVDAILQRAEAHRFACDIPLQRAAVYLRAEGELLELLVRELDTAGRTAAAVKQVQDERERALDGVVNVLTELREHGLHNLALWDLVVRCVADA